MTHPTREEAYKKIQDFMEAEGLTPYVTQEIPGLPDGTTGVWAGHPDLSWEPGRRKVAVSYK